MWLCLCRFFKVSSIVHSWHLSEVLNSRNISCKKCVIWCCIIWFYCQLTDKFILEVNPWQFSIFFIFSGIRCGGNRHWDSWYVHWWSHNGTNASTSRSCTSESLGKWRDRLQRQGQVWQHPKKNWGVYWGAEGPHRYAHILGVLNLIIITEWLYSNRNALFKEPVNKIIMNLMEQVKGNKQIPSQLMHMQIMLWRIPLW